jgi:hypothetical protein
MSKVIAIVRLAPGHVAFYDEKTSMHLTMGNPIGEVLDYYDTSRIKRAVQNKVLTLVNGSFSEIQSSETKAVDIEVKVDKPVKPIKEKVVEEVKIEEPEVVAEDVIPDEGESVETEVEIEKQTKSQKRKKKEEQ